ncbi:MAG TPA: TetR-like C-terminal domain-containing protein [Gaiellales bacterium]|jgi:AcrR family transcriptional regulator
MARPREHDERTAAALLHAAERIAETEGLEALTVRRVAATAGTTTRAVYSLFTSKEGLVVALGARGFDILREGLTSLPATADPAADLVEAGVTVFRRFALEHPALYRISVQRLVPDPGLAVGFRPSAQDALAELTALMEHLHLAGLAGERSVRDAVIAFHALCEGLATLELRSALPADRAERLWRDALASLVRGFRAD